VLNRCEHICRDTFTSYRCECRAGFKPFDRYKCVDINECVETPFVCPQLCVNRVGSYECKCAENYIKSGTQCKFSGGSNMTDSPKLLFTNNYYLRSIDLQSNEYKLIRSGLNMARGLSYDLRTGLVYVIDAFSRKLTALSLNNRLNSSFVDEQVIVPDLMDDTRSVDVDWLARKLYYLSATRLTVCELNGHHRLALLNESVLQEATSLALAPESGFVFVTDWKYPPFIARVDMNGANFTKIIASDIGIMNFAFLYFNNQEIEF
jgi:low density lipoprotein-related protein 2